MKNFIIFVAAMCVMTAVPADAMTVKLTGVVQDKENVTPFADITDSLTFAVQVLFADTEQGSVGITVQRLGNDDYIAGVGLSYDFPVGAFSPYISVSLAANVDNFSDDGAIVIGNFGVWKPLTERFGIFIEARSLTWFTGDKGSVVGAGAGITINF